MLAYVASDGLWLLGLSGRPQRLVAAGDLYPPVIWSDDGSYLIFQPRSGGPMLVRPGRRSVPVPDHVWPVAWAGDGRAAAFVGGSLLVVARPDRAGVMARVENVPSGESEFECRVDLTSVVWPRGGPIVYVRSRNDEVPPRLWTATPATVVPRPLIGDQSASEWAPAWSPRGDQLA